jgi:CRISPR-associated endonuclease/helicase Cas3
MNFLAYFCNSSIVLCSATQPLLDKLKDYQILTPRSIIGDEEKYNEAFKRVEIIDYVKGNGMSTEEAAGFILEQLNEARTLLAIVNTKPAARKVTEFIPKHFGNDRNVHIFHLSTIGVRTSKRVLGRNARTPEETDNVTENHLHKNY